MRGVTDTLYLHRQAVALYDLDWNDEVASATLFKYFEEAAMRGSSHFGFTLEWYQAQQQFWVIRTLRMERVCSPHYGDELEIRTWVSSLGRVRSDRNYEIRRRRDGQLIARGIANWVYIDAAQMLPTRIHPQLAAAFSKSVEPILPPLPKVTLRLETVAQFEFRATRRAQFFEADAMKHINNAVYVNWVEEAVRDALQAMGFDLVHAASLARPWFFRHALEYVRAAMPGDTVEILARLVSRGQTRSDWEIEITNALTHEQLLRAQTTMVWLNAGNQPVSWRTLQRGH